MITIASTVILIIGVLAACLTFIVSVIGKPIEGREAQAGIMMMVTMFTFPFFMILASLTLKYLWS